MDMKSLLEKMSELSTEAKSSVLTESSKKAEKHAYDQGRSRSLMKDKGDDKPYDDDKLNDAFAKGKKHYKGEKVEEGIVIQADGDEAASLLNLLKLSGQEPLDQNDATTPIGSEPMDMPADEPMEIPQSADGEQDSQEFEVDEADRDPTYDNTPDEETCGMDAAIPSGNDLNRPKTMTKHGYQQGDNPLAMEDIKKMEGKLSKMFESLSKKSTDSKKKVK